VDVTAKLEESAVKLDIDDIAILVMDIFDSTLDDKLDRE
jgi:hypothetical protein